MSDDVADMWAFETDRLSVGPWHEVAEWLGVGLSRVVTEMLTVRTTVAWPESCQGEHPVDSAGGWINDRDADASLLNAAGAEIRLARVKAPVQQMLDRDGAIDRLGTDNVYANFYQAVAGLIPQDVDTS